MRRWRETAVVLLGLHLGVSAGWAALAPRSEPERLMPAAEGALSELAIQFHRPAEDVFLPVYGQLLQALDPSVTVHVVVSDAEDERRFREAHADWFPEGHGPTLTFAETGRPITSWMRDRLAVVGGRILAPDQPMTGPEARVHDWTVPWTLGEHLGREVMRSDYVFEGGDLIAGPELAYVATPLFGRNPEIDETTLLSMLERDLGRPVLPLHDTPEHHIGMFLTPVAPGRVMVGDPNLALELLGRQGLTPDDISPGGRSAGVMDREQRAAFARVTGQLEDAGVEVVRLPLLPTAQSYAWLSYNNVLAETRSDGLHVYLPTYGVPSLDDAATEIWVGQGATVHPIDVSGLFRMGGSVRCLTAPVARSTLEST